MNCFYFNIIYNSFNWVLYALSSTLIMIHPTFLFYFPRSSLGTQIDLSHFPKLLHGFRAHKDQKLFIFFSPILFPSQRMCKWVTLFRWQWNSWIGIFCMKYSTKPSCPRVCELHRYRINT